MQELIPPGRGWHAHFGNELNSMSILGESQEKEGLFGESQQSSAQSSPFLFSQNPLLDVTGVVGGGMEMGRDKAVGEQ